MMPDENLQQLKDNLDSFVGNHHKLLDKYHKLKVALSMILSDFQNTIECGHPNPRVLTVWNSSAHPFKTHYYCGICGCLAHEKKDDGHWDWKAPLVRYPLDRLSDLLKND